MAVLRTAASAANLLNGVWAAYVSLVSLNTPMHCPANGCPSTLFTYLPTVLLAVAAILLLDVIVCFIGFRVGFIAGAILSGAIVILVVVRWAAFGSLGSSIALTLSAIAILLDVVSMSTRKDIPEERHPLNLPVFG